MLPLPYEDPDPETVQVGDKATYAIGSDCYAGKIDHVTRNGRLIRFKFDNGGKDIYATLRIGGLWRPRGSEGGRIYIGFARNYRSREF